MASPGSRAFRARLLIPLSDSGPFEFLSRSCVFPSSGLSSLQFPASTKLRRRYAREGTIRAGEGAGSGTGPIPEGGAS